jgi:Txe/YoeB family toxin of Txe-Axe toxin-antitoxin module
LVFNRLARSASRISLSSIKILVRTMCMPTECYTHSKPKWTSHCRWRRSTQEHRLVHRVTDDKIDLLEARYRYRWRARTHPYRSRPVAGSPHRASFRLCRHSDGSMILMI